MQTGFNDCKLVIETQKGNAEFQKTRNFKPFSKAVKALIDFRRKNEHLGYANMGFLSFLENRSWPMQFKFLDDEAQELIGWKIIFDPQKDGDKKDYAHAPDMTKALPITLDTHWEKQQAGLDWRQQHGEHYKGVAWYVASFDVPQNDDDMKFCFGAIDGSALIYLNGTLLADRPYPYKGNPDSWKLPFELQIPKGCLKPTGNSLVIRVEKYIGVSGIWRPVYLATGTAAAELPYDDIVRVKWRENTNNGTFRFSSMDYPLSVECLAKGPDGKAWGRIFQSFPVVPGHVYTVRLRYRTSNLKGRFQVWLRSSKVQGLNEASKNLSLFSMNDKEQTASVTIVPETNKLGIFLNILDDTGYAEITALSITDETSKK